MSDVLVPFRLPRSVTARLEQLIPLLNADPDSTDAAFTPIVLEDLEDGELTIVAELLEVLS